MQIFRDSLDCCKSGYSCLANYTNYARSDLVQIIHKVAMEAIKPGPLVGLPRIIEEFLPLLCVVKISADNFSPFVKRLWNSLPTIAKIVLAIISVGTSVILYKNSKTNEEKPTPSPLSPSPLPQQTASESPMAASEDGGFSEATFVESDEWEEGPSVEWIQGDPDFILDSCPDMAIPLSRCALGPLAASSFLRPEIPLPSESPIGEDESFQEPASPLDPKSPRAPSRRSSNPVPASPVGLIPAVFQDLTLDNCSQSFLSQGEQLIKNTEAPKPQNWAPDQRSSLAFVPKRAAESEVLKECDHLEGSPESEQRIAFDPNNNSQSSVRASVARSLINLERRYTPTDDQIKGFLREELLEWATLAERYLPRAQIDEFLLKKQIKELVVTVKTKIHQQEIEKHLTLSSEECSSLLRSGLVSKADILIARKAYDYFLRLPPSVGTEWITKFGFLKISGLVWQGICDEAHYMPGIVVYSPELKCRLIKSLVETYNSGAPICPNGAFSFLVNTLSDIHKDVQVVQFTSDVLVDFIRRSLKELPEESQLSLMEIANTDLSSKMLESFGELCKKAVEEDLLPNFGLEVSERGVILKVDRSPNSRIPFFENNARIIDAKTYASFFTAKTIAEIINGTLTPIRLKQIVRGIVIEKFSDLSHLERLEAKQNPEAFFERKCLCVLKEDLALDFMVVLNEKKELRKKEFQGECSLVMPTSTYAKIVSAENILRAIKYYQEIIKIRTERAKK